MAGLVGIVPALEKARLYRGRGGELMRQAACRVVECLALTESGVAIKTQVPSAAVGSHISLIRHRGRYCSYIIAVTVLL